MQRKEIAEEMASGRYRRTGPIALIVFFLVLTGIVYLVPRPGLPPRGVLGREVEFGRDGGVDRRGSERQRPRRLRGRVRLDSRPRRSSASSRPSVAAFTIASRTAPAGARRGRRRGRRAARRRARRDARRPARGARPAPRGHRCVRAARAVVRGGGPAAPCRGDRGGVRPPRARRARGRPGAPFGRSPASSRRRSSRTIPSTTG